MAATQLFGDKLLAPFQLFLRRLGERLFRRGLKRPSCLTSGNRKLGNPVKHRHSLSLKFYKFQVSPALLYEAGARNRYRAFDEANEPFHGRPHTPAYRWEALWSVS